MTTGAYSVTSSSTTSRDTAARPALLIAGDPSNDLTASATPPTTTHPRLARTNPVITPDNIHVRWFHKRHAAPLGIRQPFPGREQICRPDAHPGLPSQTMKGEAFSRLRYSPVQRRVSSTGMKASTSCGPLRGYSSAFDLRGARSAEGRANWPADRKRNTVATCGFLYSNLGINNSQILVM